MTKTDQSEVVSYCQALLSQPENDGLEVLRVYRRVGRNPWDLTGPVRFTSHHVLLVTSGQVTFHLLGESVTLHRGEVMVTAPCTDLRCDYGHGEEGTLLCARFDPVMSGKDVRALSPPERGGYFTGQPTHEATFELMMEHLLRAWNRCPEAVGESVVSALMVSILWVGCEEFVEAEAESRDERMEEIRKFLEEEPESHVTIPELAQRSGLSEGHFSRRFKKHVGVAPKVYQHQRRMRHAHFLLQEEALSVQEVADRLGYSDAFVFSRQFKKTWGVSPSKV